MPTRERGRAGAVCLSVFSQTEGKLPSFLKKYVFWETQVCAQKKGTSATLSAWHTWFPSLPCCLLAVWCCYFYQLYSNQLLLHVNMANGVKIPAETRGFQRDLSSVISRTDKMSWASVESGSGTFHQWRQWEHFWHLSDVEPGTKFPAHRPRPKACTHAHTSSGQ